MDSKSQINSGNYRGVRVRVEWVTCPKQRQVPRVRYSDPVCHGRNQSHGVGVPNPWHPFGNGLTAMTDEHGEKAGDPILPLTPRAVDAAGRIVPFSDEECRARVLRWRETVRQLATMTDETDTDEIWDEVLRNLGVDPATGGGRACYEVVTLITPQPSSSATSWSWPRAARRPACRSRRGLWAASPGCPASSAISAKLSCGSGNGRRPSASAMVEISRYVLPSRRNLIPHFLSRSSSR